MVSVGSTLKLVTPQLSSGPLVLTKPQYHHTGGQKNMFALLIGLKTIATDELHQLIQNHQATVIDVNSRQSSTKAHAPGGLSLDSADYRNGDLPPDKEPA